MAGPFVIAPGWVIARNTSFVRVGGPRRMCFACATMWQTESIKERHGMSKRDDLIAKYADDLKTKCKITPDMDLLTKVTIGCGPAIYNADSETWPDRTRPNWKPSRRTS